MKMKEYEGMTREELERALYQAQNVCAEAYQLVAMIDMAVPGLVPNAVGWLDNLANHEMLHDDLLPVSIGGKFPNGSRWRVEHDGFQGVVIGGYMRLDGEQGVVMQQDGTNVVHVYGTKWLKGI